MPGQIEAGRLFAQALNETIILAVRNGTPLDFVVAALKGATAQVVIAHPFVAATLDAQRGPE